MASRIDPSNIDTTFPVAGQDNDTQGFRNNFTIIKSNLLQAQREINIIDSLLAVGLEVVPVPISLTSTGTTNQVAFDSQYFYICIAKNSWVKIPNLSTNNVVYSDKITANAMHTIYDMSVGGDLYIRGNTYELNREIVTSVEIVGGNLVAASGATSGNVRTGALVVIGGTGISGDMYLGGNANVLGDATVTGNLTVLGLQTILGTRDLTINDSVMNLHTAANLAPLTVNDGRDIGFKLHYFSTPLAGGDNLSFLGRANDTGFLEWYTTGAEGTGNIFINGTYGTVKTGEFLAANSTPAVSPSTGALRVTGGAGILGAAFVGGNLVANANTVTANTTTGALVVKGGTGIGGVLFVGGNIVANSNTTSYTTTTGALVVRGGAGISGNSFIGGNLVLSSATPSNSTNTGALVVVGGAGISQDLYVGGNLTISGNLVPSGNVQYNLGSPTNMWKTLYISGNTIAIGPGNITANTTYLYYNSKPLATAQAAVTMYANSAAYTAGITTANLGIATFDANAFTITGNGFVSILGFGGQNNAIVTTGGNNIISGNTILQGNTSLGGNVQITSPPTSPNSPVRFQDLVSIPSDLIITAIGSLDMQFTAISTLASSVDNASIPSYISNFSDPVNGTPSYPLSASSSDPAITLTGQSTAPYILGTASSQGQNYTVINAQYYGTYGTTPGVKGTVSMTLDMADACGLSDIKFVEAQSSFVGSISGNILTVSAVNAGSISPGQTLSATGLAANTQVIGYNIAVGGTGTYLLNNSQTVGAVTFTANTIQANVVGSISGTTLTVSTVTSGTIVAGLMLSGSGVSGNTYIVSGSGTSWTVSKSQTVSSTRIYCATPQIYSRWKGNFNFTAFSALFKMNEANFWDYPALSASYASEQFQYSINMIPVTTDSTNTSYGQYSVSSTLYASKPYHAANMGARWLGVATKVRNLNVF